MSVPIAQSANDEYHAATDPSVADANGGYFVASRPRDVNRDAKDAQKRQQLWDLLVR